MTSKSTKEAVIIAGANGSGKTTFARKFLDITEYEFLNADEIAKKLNPEDPTKARIAAGRKVINLIDECVSNNKSFVIESTLAGSFLEKHIHKLKEQSYSISLTYIFLGSKELCINRIKSRVMQGGHNVPDEDVRRRYIKGLLNFWHVYAPIVDFYNIYFNNEFYDFKLIANGINNKIDIVDMPLFNEFLQQTKELNNESK